jgi:hypothetical protein
MKIGDKVALEEDLYSYEASATGDLKGEIDFHKGHIFTIIGSNDIRGVDLRDSDGKTMYECRFVKLKTLDESREEKINKILS